MRVSLIQLVSETASTCQIKGYNLNKCNMELRTTKSGLRFYIEIV